jgi:hypothetical protein
VTAGVRCDAAQIDVEPAAKAVATPVALTEATVVTDDVHVTARSVMPASAVTVPLKAAVPPTATVVDDGVTDTLRTAAAGVTVNVAQPLIAVLAFEMAQTEVTPTDAAVATPAADTAATAVLDDDHVTERSVIAASASTDAPNVNDAPFDTDVDGGETVTL